MNKLYSFIILVFIFTIGAALRIYGLKWGLTTTKYFHFATYYPDESENLKAIAILKPDKLNFKISHSIAMRGTLQIYLTAVWLKFASIVKLIKLTPSFDFYKANSNELVKLYTAARSLSVLFGIITIILLFFIAKVFYNDYKIALLSSFFLAISPAHVVWSHYIGTDIILTFELCLILLLSFYITKFNSNKLYILTGCIVGLTIATKYSSLPIVAIPFIAHFLSKRKINDKKLLWYILFIGLGFFIGNPYSIIDIKGFIQNIRNSIECNLLLRGGGYDCFEILPGWIYYLITAPKYALGIPFAVLSISSIICSVIKREKLDILILSFMLLFWLLIGFSPWRLVRWFIPFVPFLCILSARVIFAMKKYKILLNTAIFLISCYTFLYSFSYVKMMTEKDVRDEASEWIEENISEGKKIAISNMYFWNPSITMTLYWYKENEPFMKNIRKYKILQISDVEKLEFENPDYVILADYEYFPILKLKYKFPNEHILPFLNEVMNSDKFSLLKKFEKFPEIFGLRPIGGFYPHDWRYTCPTIRIYERKKGA